MYPNNKYPVYNFSVGKYYTSKRFKTYLSLYGQISSAKPALLVALALLNLGNGINDHLYYFEGGKDLLL